MASIEGSYASVYGKGPVGWQHKELAAVKLAAGVLNALESYFWVSDEDRASLVAALDVRKLQKRIRGAGLAYGASVDTEEECGILSFTVYRSPDAARAIRAAADCLQGLVDGSVSLPTIRPIRPGTDAICQIELDENIVNGARSTMAYSLARQESNVGAAVSAKVQRWSERGLTMSAMAGIDRVLKRGAQGRSGRSGSSFARLPETRYNRSSPCSIQGLVAAPFLCKVFDSGRGSGTGSV